jgi:hypothetical protein
MASIQNAGYRPAAPVTLKDHLMALAALFGIRTNLCRHYPRWEEKLRYLASCLYLGAMNAGMFLLDNVIPLYFIFTVGNSGPRIVMYKDTMNVKLVLVYVRPLPGWIAKILTKKPVYIVINTFRDFMETLVYSYFFDGNDAWNFCLFDDPKRFHYERYIGKAESKPEGADIPF